MGTYNFDEIVERAHTSSVKWEMTKMVFGRADVHPMWVADMDFKPPHEVMEAISKRAEHGIFGYTFVPPTVAEAIQGWVAKRHGWDIHQAWISYNSGVVPSIGVAILAYTEPGEKVMVQSPVYPPFFDMIKRNGREVVNSTLVEVEGTYEIDWADFEEKLSSGVKLFLLCNPHNPSGRVWTTAELIRIGELCQKHGVIILSDEIHSDLVFTPNKHVPIASLKDFKEFVVTCMAPSKTFNLAGLQASCVITSNVQLREKFIQEQHRQGFHTLNTFGIVGMEASYRYGEPWLEEVLSYLTVNIEEVDRFIQNELPQVRMMRPEGTYLIWIDCRGLGLSDEELKKALVEKAKLGLEPGPKYGLGGEGFVRMNVACSREHVLEGLKRLKIAFGS